MHSITELFIIIKMVRFDVMTLYQRSYKLKKSGCWERVQCRAGAYAMAWCGYQQVRA